MVFAVPLRPLLLFLSFHVCRHLGLQETQSTISHAHRIAEALVDNAVRLCILAFLRAGLALGSPCRIFHVSETLL